MQYSHLLRLLKETKSSPEDLAELVGVSGMTVRRWLNEGRKGVLPKLYVAAVKDAVYELIATGKLAPGSQVATDILSEGKDLHARAAMTNLGLAGESLSLGGDPEGFLLGLSQIGAQPEKRQAVENNKEKVFSFVRLGKNWGQYIKTLWSIVKSKKFSTSEKLVAYGALFYLLTPIDFIPDQIPFFGLLDDIGVLGLAVAFYSDRASRLN